MTRFVGTIDDICRKYSYKIDKSHGATYMADQVLLCVYRESWSAVDSIITYEGYLESNYDNGERADMNLETGVFTCLTPGFYTITYSGHSRLMPGQENNIWLLLNGNWVGGGRMEHELNPDTVGNYIALQGSRSLVSKCIQ